MCGCACERWHRVPDCHQEFHVGATNNAEIALIHSIGKTTETVPFVDTVESSHNWPFEFIPQHWNLPVCEIEQE